VLTDGDNALLFDDKTTGSFSGALDTITRLDLTWLGNARRVVTLAQSVRG